MFSVPIVHYPIENWSENKKKILDALPPEDDSQLEPNGTGLYTDFFINGKVKELPSYFHTVVDVIKPYLKSFMDGNPVEFVEMWYQNCVIHHIKVWDKVHKTVSRMTEYIFPLFLMYIFDASEFGWKIRPSTPSFVRNKTGLSLPPKFLKNLYLI